MDKWVLLRRLEEAARGNGEVLKMGRFRAFFNSRSSQDRKQRAWGDDDAVADEAAADESEASADVVAAANSATAAVAAAAGGGGGSTRSAAYSASNSGNSRSISQNWRKNERFQQQQQ